jgi:glutamate synthase (NADPH/NADH) small chain
MTETTKRKAKFKEPRVKMPEQKPADRAKNFSEVPFGLTAEQAQYEAQRCLQCKDPKCIPGCPVEIDIPGFILAIENGEFLEAARILKDKNALPAVCGRVCPQEDQCEKTCVMSEKFDTIAIGMLERFAADYERDYYEKHPDEKPEYVPPEQTGKRVAVIGSGPAGLTVAGDLIKEGHSVTVFEALHEAGGVLVYGIPEFRLPKSIVKAEVDALCEQGVDLRKNAIIGKLHTIPELMNDEHYDAVFIGTGAGLPSFMRIPGEHLNGVFSANEYLTRSNLMRAYEFPKADTPIIRGRRVVVLGGGNTAMDAVRIALRLGAESATIMYRRSRVEMPARIDEIHHAEEEGIRFEFLTTPVEILGNEDGWVTGMRCIRMELGEPDASGRRRPIPIEGSEFEEECDVVVVAIGNSSNPLISKTTEGLAVNKWGNIIVDEDTQQTSIPGVFAGGDIVTGGATVILAMGAGRMAARAISCHLKGEKLPTAKPD